MNTFEPPFDAADRPWLVHYSAGTSAVIPIPDEPVTAGLERSVLRWPDRVAIDFLGATLTYAQVDVRIRQAMSVLVELGVGPGERVGLVMPNCSSHVVAFHAVLRLGAVAVELNPTYTAAEMEHLLADADVHTVLVWRHGVADVVAAQSGSAVQRIVAVDVAADLPRRSRLLLKLPVSKAKEKRAALDGAVPKEIPIWHELLAAAPEHRGAAQPRGEDLALLQYTGGTTGTPKAARLLHRNLVANLVHAEAWADVEEGAETVFGILPFFHAFGLTFSLTLPGYLGATLVAFPNFDPAAVIDAQRRRPATFIAGVAPMFDRIVDALAAAPRKPVHGLSSIRLAFAGAMPIPARTVRRWEEATGGLLIEGYGMTECAPIALGNPAEATRRPGTLGVPFPNTEMRIVDQDDPEVLVQPAADGSRRGELLVRGPQVFDGYWNRPEETAGQLLADGWLRTGDVVLVDADGWVTLVDRIKEMIIVGGFKVYPSQVEEHVRLMPGVSDVAVVGLLAGEEEQVAAVLVMEAGASAPSLEDVRAFGEQKLPRYALPRSVHVVEELPRSQIGKVLRRVVRDAMTGS